MTLTNSFGIDATALFCPTIELGVALIAACEPSLKMAYSGDNPQGDRNSPEAAWRQLMRRHKRDGSGEAPLSSIRSSPQRSPGASSPNRDVDKEGRTKTYSLREIL